MARPCRFDPVTGVLQTDRTEFVGIENVTGSDGDDEIFGDSNANVLSGLDGDDLLMGGGGNDVLTSGDGTDVMKGDAGDDILRVTGDETGGINYLTGGEDADTFIFETDGFGGHRGKIEDFSADDGDQIVLDIGLGDLQIVEDQFSSGAGPQARIDGPGPLGGPYWIRLDRDGDGLTDWAVEVCMAPGAELDWGMIDIV